MKRRRQGLTLLALPPSAQETAVVVLGRDYLTLTVSSVGFTLGQQITIPRFQRLIGDDRSSLVRISTTYLELEN
jgi:hypothetical protein